MPIFVYRAVTNNGTIVRNKVEDINRKSLIKKLKRNNLTPINIVQVNRIVSKRTQKQKRIHYLQSNRQKRNINRRQYPGSAVCPWKSRFYCQAANRSERSK